MQRQRQQRMGRRDDPYAVATRLLAMQARSVRALGDRLRAKGFPEDEIPAVLDTFRMSGLLDDERLARALVEQVLARKPVGRRWLVARLRRAQIPDELSRRVIGALVPPERERALASEAAGEKREALRRQGGAAANAAVARFLAARGFSADAIGSALHAGAEDAS